MKKNRQKSERINILSALLLTIVMSFAFSFNSKALDLAGANTFNALDASDGSTDGVFTVAGDLHLLAGASITPPAPPAGMQFSISGNFIMETGSSINGDGPASSDGIAITINVVGNVTLNGTASIHSLDGSGCHFGGAITIIAQNGDITTDVGSSILADGCSGGAILIQTLNPAAKITINGLVRSKGSLTGVPNQPPGGGTITIIAGCKLIVTPTGEVSSIGFDPGADLVHLEACVVGIYGLVQSTGAGHVSPVNPPNHLHGPTRPDKPANSTAGVEVWASDSIIVDATNGNKGEINADITLGAEHNSWIDLFARKTIIINGDNSACNAVFCNPGNTCFFAVHANNGGAGNHGGIITVKSIEGTVAASGRAIAANSRVSSNGGSGGIVTVEADLNVTLNDASIWARGCAGSGGTIKVRSFDGDILNNAATNFIVFGNGSVGTVTLTECGTTAFVGSTDGTAGVPVPTTGICGGAPSLPCVQNPDPTCNCACTPYVVLPASCGGSCCTACITIRKFVQKPDDNCSITLVRDWDFTGDLGNFTIHADQDSMLFGVLVGYVGDTTICSLLPGTYTVNEVKFPVPLTGAYWRIDGNTCDPNPGSINPDDHLKAVIEVTACESHVCTFKNVSERCKTGCQWCNKGAVLSQVWQNPGKLTHDACVVPDILVDVMMTHGGANDVVDASEIGTGEPATWSIQAAVDYVNAHGDPSPVSTPGEIFIGVTSTQPTTVDPLDPNSCGYSCSRTLGGDNPHGVENVIVTNVNSERLNIFGCSVTMWPANANLPVFTIQNSVGKVTILDLHVKYDNVAGYLIKSGNADLVVVKNSAAWYNDIGYDVQDNNVEITGAQHIYGNRIGILVSGSNVKLRTNSDVVKNTEAGIKITGSNNSTDGNEVGVSGKPNALGILVTGNSNEIKGDAVNYNTGNGVVVSGNLNTIDDVDANNNGGIAFLVTGNSNTITGNKQVKNNGGDGFKITGLNNLLEGNVAESNGGNGFKADIADGASGNKFDDNEAKSNALQGIRACGQIDLGDNDASGNLVDPQITFSCGLLANAKFTVVDINTDKAYKYDGSFNLISTASLTGNNGDANDAAASGTSTYVLDKNDKQVYRYVGGNAVSRPLKTNGGGSLNTPSGLAIDGDQMWVLDYGNKYIYRYSLSAAFTGNTNYTALQGIALAANNSKAEGLAIDANYLYVVDNNTKQFYRYPRGGGAGVVSKVFKDNGGSSLSNAMGAVLDGTTMWIVDNSKLKAYSYTLVSLGFGVAGNVNAGSAFALYSLNTKPTGIAVGTSSNLLREELAIQPAAMSDALLQVYPNPADGNVTVQFISSTANQYSLSIMDMSGRIVKTFSNSAVEGINTVDIDLYNISSGVYYLIIQNPNMKEVKRLIVHQ